MAGPVCIPTACRRLGGQLLLPAPFPHPRASPDNLCNQPLLSHFKILQDKKTSVSFKHLLKMTGCVCETCRGEEDRGWGGGGGEYVSKTGKNIKSGFHGWVGDGKSWTNL